MLNISVAAVLLVAAPTPCFALMGIDQVSEERAKELGIEIRVTAAGPNAVWLELQFKAEGKLKDFSHVSLEIRDGERLLMGYAPMQEKRSSSGSVVVRFMVDRAFLEKVTLSVVEGFPSNMTGHELRVKDFVELDKVR